MPTDNPACSPPKRTRKAATRSPSTTCSTTATELVRPIEAAPHQAADHAALSDVLLLTLAEQRALLSALLRGASPAGACQQANLEPRAFLVTMGTDADFRSAVAATFDLLSFNVAAALYQNAMKGNATAQQHWLRLHPPPVWQATLVDPVDQLDTLTEEALHAQHQSLGSDLAGALAARPTAATGD